MYRHLKIYMSVLKRKISPYTPKIINFIKILMIVVPAIWAAYWAYHEYRTAQLNTRIANSMKYVEHYNKSEVFQARYAIWGSWLEPEKLKSVLEL